MIDRNLKLFACLNAHQVEYLLIGGTLAIAYGVPRVTKDVDIFIRPTLENASRCLDALQDAGLGTAYLIKPEEVQKTEITIFKDVVRVDVLTQVKGLDFDEAWQNRQDLTVDHITIICLSLDDLIKTKKASDRPNDREDIKILEIARRSQS